MIHALVRSGTRPSYLGGRIVRYQWDLDFTPNNFERDTGGTPTTTWQYEHPGTYAIGLKVTDDTGAQATTTRTIFVDANAAAGSARSLLRRTQGSGAVFRFRPQFPEMVGEVPDSLLSPEGDITVEQAVQGRVPVKLLPGRLRAGARRARWVGNFNITWFAAGGAKFAGVALVRVPAGGLACLGVRANAPATGSGIGGLEVVGGTRSASALRGALAGTARLRDGEVILQGRNRLRLSFKARGGLGTGECAALRPLIVRAPEPTRAVRGEGQALSDARELQDRGHRAAEHPLRRGRPSAAPLQRQSGAPRRHRQRLAQAAVAVRWPPRALLPARSDSPRGAR